MDFKDLIRYGTIIADHIDEEANTRKRIVEYEGRIYVHEMKDGAVTRVRREKICIRCF